MYQDLDAFRLGAPGWPSLGLTAVSEIKERYLNGS